MNSIDDDILQYIFAIVQEGYETYKKNHPDFAKAVEEQSEGKADAEFEAQFKEARTHCEFCGEWLQGFDTCSECGRINL